MALRIEITRKDWNEKWDLRIGDIDGSSEHCNITASELLDAIADRMKELEFKQTLIDKNNLNFKKEAI